MPRLRPVVAVWGASRRRFEAHRRVARSGGLKTCQGKTTGGGGFFRLSRRFFGWGTAREADAGHGRVEDNIRTRIGDAAANFALIRHVALNLLRGINDKLSIRRRRRRCGSYQDYLEAALTGAAATSATLR